MSVLAAMQQSSSTAVTPGAAEPLIDEETKQIRRRTVPNAKAAYTHITALREQRKRANAKNAAIERNYQGAPPLDPTGLRNAGAAWRHNFSTRPMATIIERAAPTYVAAVNGLASLTQSRLRDQSADGQRKTQMGREIVTKMIRGWAGWSDFISQAGNETCKMGYCASIRWDADWRPALLRQGEFCVDQRALHDETRLAMIFADRELQPAELHRIALEDPEAAADAGWDVDAVAKAINCARPAVRTTDHESREMSESERQDSWSEQSEVPVVEVSIFMYAEASGKVSRYVLKKDDGTKLFFRADVEDGMADVVRFFSANQGTGKLYSSQGLGRWLVNPAIVLDRVRCEFLDAIKIVSRAVLKIPEAGKTAATVTVQSPFITLTGDAELGPMPINLPVEAYLAADRALVGFLEVIAGAYLPSQIQADQKPKTATEASQTAQREDAIRGNLLIRFIGQIAGAVEMMQRAAFGVDTIAAAVRAHKASRGGGQVVSKREGEMLRELAAELGEPAPSSEVHALEEGVDEEAVLACIALLEAGFTPMEIIEFTRSPAADPMRQSPEALGAQLRSIAAAYPGSPLIDQAKFARMDIQQIAGAAVADELVQTPTDLQANAVEAKRLQVLESAAILAGEKIEVSPLDDHVSHFASLKEKGGELLEAMSKLPHLPDIGFVERLIALAQHGNAHLAGREQKGERGAELNADKAWAKKMEKELMGLQQRSQQAAQQAQAEQQQAAAQEAAMQAAMAQQQAAPAPEMQAPAAPAEQDLILPDGVGIPVDLGADQANAAALPS